MSPDPKRPDLSPLFETIDKQRKTEPALDAVAVERRERLKHWAKKSHEDARTLLAASALTYMTSKGMVAVGHSDPGEALKLAADIPLGAIALGAWFTQVMAGLRTAIDLPTTAWSALSYRHALHKRDRQREQALGSPALEL